MTGNRVLEIRIGDWGFWIGDWRLRIGDWDWGLGLRLGIEIGD